MLDGEQNPSRRQVIGRVAGGWGSLRFWDAGPRLYHEFDGPITQKAAEEAAAIKATKAR